MNRSITANTQVGTVPEIASPKYVDFLERYRLSCRKAAQGMIEMAKTIAEAKKELRAEEFATLCAEVGLSRSTLSKYLTIGENAHRFESDLDRVPQNWTTMYQLAKLTNEDYERVAGSKRFAPTMKAKEIEAIVSPNKPMKLLAGGDAIDDKPSAPAAEPVIDDDNQDDVYTITIDLSALDDDQKRDAYFTIKEVRVDSPFNMVLSDALQRLIDQKANDTGASAGSAPLAA
jgi:hypothetical protein